jgi:hypothetical protein
MQGLFELGASFFGRRAQNGVRITGAAYESHNINNLQLLKQKHNLKFINENDTTKTTIYRGVSAEHFLGSAYPGLGVSTMRPSFAHYLQSKRHTFVDDLSPSEKKEITDAHVKGFSLIQGNTKIAHSYSYNPSVALGFGIDAARKSNYPEFPIVIASNVAESQAWDVTYDPFGIDGEHSGTSIFAYQNETILPYLISPPHHCIVVNQKERNCIQLDELKQAKRFDAAFDLSTLTPETIRKHQQLEIDKVIAYDDFIQQVNKSGNPNDSKAIELYEKYKSILKEQSTLVNMSLCKRELWVSIAGAVAPKTYNCISANADGFTIELPKKDGRLVVSFI